MRAQLLSFLILLGLCGTAFGQDTSVAAAIAERQEAEERYRRLSADVEGLLAANAALQKRLSALADELRNVRDGQEKLSRSTSTQDELRRLAEKIQEVDKKRADDRELILKQLQDLKTLLASAPSAPVQHDPPPRKNGDDIKIPDKGYEYVVQAGDTFIGILNAFNAEFKKQGLKQITLKQLQEANPAVKASQLRVGQKLFIPMP